MITLRPSLVRKQLISREHRILRWAGRSLTFLVAILGILIGGAWSYDTYASGHTLAAYPPIGQFVQVGGAKMHYLCQGTGEPTLVLEAGIPGGILDWTPVMTALAARHRVCAFDRLGQDWSDPAPHPRTFSTAADELHIALQEIGIVRPVIVGHSFGGALVQVYAAKYDVAGVVLVDGVTTGIVDKFAQLLGGNQKLDPFARLGLMRPVVGILEPNLDFPPETRQVIAALRSRSSAWISMSDEGVVAQQSMAKELRAAEPMLNMPLLIIAAGKSNVMGLGVGTFAKYAKELSDRKPNSTFVLLPDARHYIQAEQPKVLVDEIESWLKTIS